MTQPLPPGQGPVDPRAAFSPPPPPGAGGGWQPPQVPGSRQPVQQPAAYPPMMYPPLMPPPPPPRRGGAGWAVACVLLLLLLVGSVLLNVVMGVGILASSMDGHPVASSTLVDGSADEQVAVVPLSGIITDVTRQKFDEVMRQVGETRNLKGLILDIDSPGGEVAPSDEIYQRVMKFKAEHPTVAVASSIRGMGASGAYYAACATDHLVAEETTITGSIGVLWPSYSFYDLMQKYGVKDATIVSNGTPYKDAGSPTRQPNPDAQAYLQGLVDSEFARFKAVVQKSRGAKLKPNIDEVANGKAYAAQDAVKSGLVDEIGYLDKAVAWVAATAKLGSPNVVRFDVKTTIFDRLPFSKQQGGPAVDVRVNGINVEVDRGVIDQLSHPRPMAILEKVEGRR